MKKSLLFLLSLLACTAQADNAAEGAWSLLYGGERRTGTAAQEVAPGVVVDGATVRYADFGLDLVLGSPRSSVIFLYHAEAEAEMK